jgi:hypothetical protein
MAWENRWPGKILMKNPIIPKPIFYILIAGVLLLPIATLVVLGVGTLLSTMGDLVGSRILDRVGLALGIFWGLDLIFLIIALAIQSWDDNSRQL